MQSKTEQSKDKLINQYLQRLGVATEAKPKARQMLQSYKATEIARPLVLEDYETGNYTWMQLAIKYGITLHNVRTIIRNKQRLKKP